MKVFESHIFLIDNASSEPRYVQLEKAIKKWVESADLGDRLPPELEIAELAGVTRKTVRKALEPFMEQGVFSRRARIGTVLEKKMTTEFEAFHPLEGAFSFVPVKTLKVSLFSASKYRQQHWLELIDCCNKLNSNYQVELIWAPNSINSPEAYQEFVKEQQVDLIFLSDNLFSHFYQNKQLRQFDDSIVTKMKSDEYSFNSFFSHEPDYPLDYIMPLYFSMSGMLWNDDMTGDISQITPLFMECDSALTWLGQVDEKIAENDMLFSNIGYFLGGFGFPQADADEEYISDWLRKGYAAIAQLAGLRHQIHVNDNYKYEFVSMFLKRKVVTSMLNMYAINHYLDSLSFEWKACPLKASPGSFNNTGYNGFAISAESEQADAAVEFMDFLLSDNCQAFLAKNFHFGVFNRKAASELCDSTFKGTKPEDLDNIISLYRFHSRNTEKWLQTVSIELRKQISDVFLGALSVEDAVKNALRHYQQLGDDFKFGGLKL
jgi:DNA-binding transcriptional regulator YhcF (GntR family)